MPLIESQPDAAARMYARSLIDLAFTQGGNDLVEQVGAELEEVLDLARTMPRFGEFLASRAISVDARAASLKKIFEGRIHGVTYRFLQVLNEKGRISSLPAVAGAFDAEMQARFGRVEVDVFTAAPLDAENQATLRQQLLKAVGKEVVLHPYTDESMIGGVKIRIGDQLIDGSFSTRLRRMAEKIDTDGAAVMRSRIDKILGS